MPNFNLGLTLKPLPNGSVYVAYATSSNPVGAEFDGTAAQYGGLAPALNGNPNQIFGPEKNKAIEVGTKWELFDRRLLVTGGAVPDRKGKCAGVAEHHRLDCRGCPYVLVRPRGTVLHHRRRGLSHPRHRSRRRRQDHRQMERVRRPRADAVGGDKVAGSVAAALIFPTNVGLKLANVAHQSFSMLTKYKLTDVWEIGGQAVYRSKMYGGTFLAANQGTSIPSYWRFDTFVEYKVDKNWTAKLFVNNIINKLYYDALYQSATPFVFVAPGRSVSHGAVGAVLRVQGCRWHADLRPRCVEQGRCGGFPPHHG